MCSPVRENTSLIDLPSAFKAIRKEVEDPITYKLLTKGSVLSCGHTLNESSISRLQALFRQAHPDAEGSPLACPEPEGERGALLVPEGTTEFFDHLNRFLHGTWPDQSHRVEISTSFGLILERQEYEGNRRANDRIFLLREEYENSPRMRTVRG